MQLVTLEISDDYYDKFLHVVDALPLGKVNFKNDTLKNELAQRIEAIDSGKEKLTPYMDGMNDMLQRVKTKYADS